jgi:homoserine O-acetyltransferase
VVCHAFTGSADADRWWSKMFGPGRALDPERDFVICANILGSCYGTTGPASIDPATGRPYLGAFPAITVRDMVRVQGELCRALGVRQVRSVIGGSLGGMQVLEWALLFPEMVRSIVPIASSARHSAWAIGLSEAQRQAIVADARWAGGLYDPAEPPVAGLAAARMMAMCTYRGWESFEERYGRRPQTAELFAMESYLRYQGQQLVDRFDAATYHALTRAMDTHDVARGRGEFEAVLRTIRQPALVVSVDTDVLYVPEEQRVMARHMPAARLERLDSPHGHDAFLIHVDELSAMVADFRDRVEGRSTPRPPARPASGGQGVNLLVLACCALAVGVMGAAVSVWPAVGFALLVAAGVGWSSVLLMARGVWLDVAVPLLAVAVAAFGSTAYQYFVEGREKRQVKRTFSRFVSKDVYEQLVADPSSARVGGARRDMSVLFADIRGFTTMTERGRPEEVVAQLNEYFSRMVDEVFAHRGTVDKFVGDMVMALFGAPVADADHADHAVQAALGMLSALSGLNAAWAAAGKPPLEIGIGVNSGEMVAGIIGSDTVMSYTVIGDAVNLGSRLESLNKEYGTRLIISRATRDRLKGRYDMKPLGAVTVKGKSEPVDIFEVLARTDGRE